MYNLLRLIGFGTKGKIAPRTPGLGEQQLKAWEAAQARRDAMRSRNDRAQARGDFDAMKAILNEKHNAKEL